VVALEDKELDETRIVNINHANAALHKGDQHGVILKSAEAPKEAGAQGDADGAAQPEDFKGKMHPKDCTEIDIYADNISSGLKAAGKSAGVSDNKVNTAIGLSIRDTIAHEIGHACGLVHHGIKTLNPAVREITVAEHAFYRAYDETGKELIPTKDHPVEITGDVGAVGGLSSGDIHCIMCYNNSYLWVYLPGDGKTTPNCFYKVPPIPADAANTFCTSPAGTGINAAGHKPVSYFGDATNIDADGCMGMFDLKDY